MGPAPVHPNTISSRVNLIPKPPQQKFQTQAAAAHVTTLPPHALTDDDRLALYAWYKIAAGGGTIGPSSAR